MPRFNPPVIANVRKRFRPYKGPGDRTLFNDRLLKLADFLAKLRKEQFDLTCFVADGQVIQGRPCGTICCALGWCPAIFEGSESPFRWLESNWSSAIIMNDFGIDSVCGFFGLHGNVTTDLFYFGSIYDDNGDRECIPLHLVTPKMVARAIREVVKLSGAHGTH